VEQHNKRISFPKELFDGLVDEAIEDLCQTGLGQKEIYRILDDSLGPQIAERYIENFQKSAHNSKSTIATNPRKGVKTN
jgi:hypothetical protein